MQLATRRHGPAPRDLIATVSDLPARVTALAAAAILLAVFQLDRNTGEAPFQHLYYLGIVLAALRFGLRGGVLASLAAIALYHVANPRLLTFAYGEGDIVQMALFVGIGLVTAKVAHDSRRLRQLAATDDLTGLRNLRAFEDRLETLLRTGEGTAAPLAMLALDVDRLKSLNDRFGHLTGAEAVRTVGGVIRGWAGPGATACRYGGDEFIVVIPRCSKARAIERAEALRQAVQDLAPSLAGRAFPRSTLSVSIGVACRDESGAPLPPAEAAASGERLFRAADAALYRAKASGRNAIHAAWLDSGGTAVAN